MLHKIYQAKVMKGLGNGKSKSFATVNLDPKILPKDLAKGVYAAWVFFNHKKYKGALFYGPRKILAEKKDVLEIHLLDFAEDIYGQEVSFSLESFIRPNMAFPSFALLKKQITQDIQAITACLVD